ncbi:hypothetical protein [Streptomyces sp. cg35]|uniref:hypothetical protein n=1 Tax=Streptomyces sp. cg35 TaxID=3421650 RepID=UPI003D17F1A9
MIRIVTTSRIAQLEADAHTAHVFAWETTAQANEAFGQHVRELHAVTDRAERAESATSEVGVLLARAVEELAAAQEELLLKDIEIRRLREEAERRPIEGESLTVLLHYGQPHTIYASREDAHADTAVHGYPADHVWSPRGERSPYACQWSCEAFTYSAASNGFRRVYRAVAEPMGGAA